MTTRAHISQLLAVAGAAAAIDQASKLAVRATLSVGEHRHLGLGIGLGHIQRAGIRSQTLTVIIAVVFVLSALAGALTTRPYRRLNTWLAGGLLVGGALSSFAERAIAGSTTEWLSLPFGVVISLAYLEMLVGASGLFFTVGRSRRRPRPPELSTNHEQRCQTR